MGYSNISIGGSDMAADTWYVADKAFRMEGPAAALRALRQELEHGEHNEYNTDGCINVALVLVDSYMEDRDGAIQLCDELPKAGTHYQELVKDTLDKLTQLRSTWADADWGDNNRRRDGTDNKKWHLDAVDRLLAGLKFRLG